MRAEKLQGTDAPREEIECGLREFGYIPEASSKWAATIVSFLEEGPSGWSAEWGRESRILRLIVPLDSEENRVVLMLWRIGMTVLGERTNVYSKSEILGCVLKRMSPTEKALVLTTGGGNKILLVRDTSKGQTSLQVEVA